MFEQIQGNPEYLYGSDGIPENAIIDNVGWDMQHDGIVYRVLHESFDPLLEGMIPLYKSINITVKRVVK